MGTCDTPRVRDETPALLSSSSLSPKPGYETQLERRNEKTQANTTELMWGCTSKQSSLLSGKNLQSSCSHGLQYWNVICTHTNSRNAGAVILYVSKSVGSFHQCTNDVEYIRGTGQTSNTRSSRVRKPRPSIARDTLSAGHVSPACIVLALTCTIDVRGKANLLELD
eukprot:IDg8373t1